MTYRPKYFAKRSGVHRSGLEGQISKQLETKKVPYSYEEWGVPYVVPASNHTYTPDFILDNGIIIEVKGLWETDDRKKHLLLKEQHPDLDIRFVFSSSQTKLYKGSKTSYAEFCEKHNIKFADKAIPLGWLKEPKKSIPYHKLKPKKRGEV